MALVFLQNLRFCPRVQPQQLLSLRGVSAGGHPSTSRLFTNFQLLRERERSLRYLSTTEKMPSRRIRSHYEQLSEFERSRTNGLKEAAGWAKRRIARHIGRSDAVVRRCWQEWV
ncbi:hypothetical protein TNCV_1548651 [Trichonephila clavipes]|nr:hypothetical protein TNCV_1548651 [Trichonephila clavipes]